MLLFFTAETWCPRCSQLKETIVSNGAICRQIEERFVPIEVVYRRPEEGATASDEETLLAKMQVKGFPTLVVCRVNGTVAVRQSGFSTRHETYSFLQNALGRLEALEARARRSGKH